MDINVAILPLIIGWILDLLFGDPPALPHPIVWFGKMTGWCEHKFNKGNHCKLKGGITAIALILIVFLLTWLLIKSISSSVWFNVVVHASSSKS